MKQVVFILLISLIAFIGNAQNPPPINIAMGRGINVGNVMSAPVEGNWAPAFTQSYFDDIENAGFRTVRIPIRFNNHTTPLASVTYTGANGDYIGSINDYQVDVSYLNRIEQVVNWALSNGLYAIIDVHGDKWFWESYDSSSNEYKTGNDRLAAIDRFKAIWRDISVKFQNTSNNLFFEIMNEPYFSMSASEVDTINTTILGIIRNTNPSRFVIITGGGNNSWQAPLQISNTLIAGDNHLIATFHYYRPFSFTSSSKPQFNNFTWGSQSEKNQVDANFDAVENWSNAHNIPVLLGEFGADNEGGYNYFTQTYGNNGGPENASRVAYYEYLSNAAISRGFAFTVWDAGEKSNKTIYKVSSRAWVEDVKNAVLGITANTTNNTLNNLSIYPNPITDSIVNIQSTLIIKNIKLFNIYGQIVFQKDNTSQRIALPTNLTDGTYFFRLTTKDNRIINKKIIINKH